MFDRVVETDPGGFKVTVAPDYLKQPPQRVAVLPFTDMGSADFVVDKIALTHRNREERNRWAWTDAQRLRRAMHGYLASREFLVANLLGVDAVLKNHGIEDARQLAAVPPQELGRLLGVDAVIYGRILHYESYYLFLGAAWEVGIETSMVSTHSGRTLIHATGSRWEAQVLPAIDVQDILINSAQNILQLRDINLARAEEEACREIVKRIPVSDRLEEEIEQDAVERSIGASDVSYAAPGGYLVPGSSPIRH